MTSSILDDHVHTFKIHFKVILNTFGRHVNARKMFKFNTKPIWQNLLLCWFEIRLEQI